MYKCKICKKSFTELQGLYNHIERKHKHMIPENMDVEQYYYYMKTGRVNGNCVMCKQPTSWNKNTKKYNRFCDNPKCKEKYAEEFRKRMIGKYGKVHLLNDPEKQREMLANRKISGRYEWDDGTKTVYTGSYEHDFLKMMDGFFDWDPADIMMPSPHNYVYKYNGEDKYYIPDVFIPSLNLEIEIKDGGDNPNMHYKIQDVDKVKEKNKDEVMTSQKSFHYIKLTNKNYTNFFNFLKEIKDQFEKYGDENKIPRIFKIEDIKTGSNVKMLKESNHIVDYIDDSLMESGYLTFSDLFDSLSDNIINGKVNDMLKKVEKINVRDLEKITNMYIKQADDAEGFEAIRNHSISLMKKSKSKDDIKYVEALVRKITHKLNDEYQKGKINKNDVIEFNNWLNKDFAKELKKQKQKCLSESFIVTESSISYDHLNKALQADNDERLRDYMKTYDDYYNNIIKDNRAASNHINDDINKAIKYINDLKNSNKVNNKLADIAIREFKHYGDKKKYICENTDCNDDIYLYMVFDHNKKRQVFMLNDSDSKLFIGEENYISRVTGNVYHTNGAGACSIHTDSLSDNISNKRVIKYRLISNSILCLDTIIEILRNDKYIRINSLYKINDERDTFMDDVRAVFKRHCAIDVESIVQISDDVYDEKGSVVDGSSKIE